MQTLTTVNNTQLLDLLGLIEPAGSEFKFSDRALVLKDRVDIDDALPKGWTFPLVKLLTKAVFKKEELEIALQELPHLY